MPAARLAVILAAWAGATLFGLFVAATTKIGPKIIGLSYNHGVHLGDLVAFAAAYLVAALVTFVVWPAQNRK